MYDKLVIVESPSKSKTIENYLGKEYHVTSSKGHIRDLSTSGKDGLGIDVSATLVNLNELVANVMDSYNVVEIDNDYVNNIIYYGRGAGRYVTASAVVSDIMKTHQVERWSHNYEDCKHVYPISSSRYYVRASKPVDIPYETYYSEKDDHIYITEEIELADLKNKLDDENAVIFKVRG